MRENMNKYYIQVYDWNGYDAALEIAHYNMTTVFTDIH
jgi:hypothetical protein